MFYIFIYLPSQRSDGYYATARLAESYVVATVNGGLMNTKNLLRISLILISSVSMQAQNEEVKLVETLKESLAYTLHYESERSFGNARGQKHYIDLVSPAITKILELPISTVLLARSIEHRAYGFKEYKTHLAVVAKMHYDLVQTYMGATRAQYEKVILFQERVLEVIIKKYSDETIDAAHNAHEIIAILDNLVQQFYREKESLEERIRLAVALSETQRNGYGEFLNKPFSDEDVHECARHIFYGAQRP